MSLFRRESDGEPTEWRPPITKVQLGVAFALGVIGAFLTNEAQSIARVITAPPGTPFVRGDRRLELVAALEALDDAAEWETLGKEHDEPGGDDGKGNPLIRNPSPGPADGGTEGDDDAKDDGMPKAQVTGGLSGTSRGSIERPFA